MPARLSAKPCRTLLSHPFELLLGVVPTIWAAYWPRVQPGHRPPSVGCTLPTADPPLEVRETQIRPRRRACRRSGTLRPTSVRAGATGGRIPSLVATSQYKPCPDSPDPRKPYAVRQDDIRGCLDPVRYPVLRVRWSSRSDSEIRAARPFSMRVRRGRPITEVRPPQLQNGGRGHSQLASSGRQARLPIAVVSVFFVGAHSRSCTSIAQSADWSSCADELDTLVRSSPRAIRYASCCRITSP